MHFMAFVTLLAASYPIAALSASTSQPSPGTGSAVSGPHLSRGVPKDAFAGVLDSSTKPVESDSSSIITPIGSSRLANGSYTPPNTNTNGSIFDIPFEYPGLDGIEASDADIQCKESFGANLSRTSCNNALMNLGSRSDSLTWGQRGHGNFQLKLPFRASSSDGFCAIDVVHAKDAISDIASPADIRRAATQLINGCVKNGAPNTGGLIRKVGHSEKLIVIVRLYIPGVTCTFFTHPQLRSTCLRTLEVLPVTRESLVFGRAGDPSTRVILPRTFVPAYAKCKATIWQPPAAPPPVGVITSWFDIWEAANAVEAVCLGNENKNGYAMVGKRFPSFHYLKLILPMSIRVTLDNTDSVIYAGGATGVQVDLERIRRSGSVE